jgi:hypothetical protein
MIEITYEHLIDPESGIFDWTIKSKETRFLYIFPSWNRFRVCLHLLSHLVLDHDVSLQQGEEESAEANAAVSTAETGLERLPWNQESQAQV